MDILAWVYCPTCRTGIPLYELPDIDEEEEIEVQCSGCLDTLTVVITISREHYD